ncbi:MAG: ribbon-helix-helix domain-containing protein [Candidatus Bathyarchaeia archaeon]|jgi:hypothetical protein
MPEGKYRSISLSKELVETIEDLIKENPQASYKSIADFVADAVRIRFEQLGVYPGNISLLDINANELGPLLYDKNLKKTVQILITPKGLECAECKQTSCRHIKFAIANPQTQKLIQERKKEGWKLPDV